MEITEKQAMVRDVALQVAMFLIMVLVFLFMHGIPQRILAWLRLPSRKTVQGKRHFVRGAQLLDQARASFRNNRKKSDSFAKEALAEAEKAIAIDPKDAASYLLKAMVLDLQGFRTSALEALDAALSPLTAKSLADEERGDALLKRAELKIAINKSSGGGDGRVESAIVDLKESTKLSPKNVRGWCLLGECYEEKEMEEEARNAYKEALELEPELSVAQEALKRLGSG